MEMNGAFCEVETEVFLFITNFECQN